MYVLNMPRSDEDNREEKLDGLCETVENNNEVPNADKEKMREVCKHNNVNGRSWLDQLTRGNIWDCFVEIFHYGLHQL